MNEVIAAASTVVLDVNTIILALIGLAGTSVTGFLAMRMAKIAAESKETKESLKEIHVAVNSAKSVLETKIDDLVTQNVELSKKVATLEENKRGTELAKAVASIPPGLVVVPSILAPAHTSGPSVGKLDHAITELADAAKETVVAAEQTVALAEKVPEKLKIEP